MADTGFLNAGTYATVAFGDFDWTVNLAGLQTKDSSVTTTAVVGSTGGQEDSYYLQLTNFGFENVVPASAIVDGIEFNYRWKCTTSSANSSIATPQLLLAGSTIGASKSGSSSGFSTAFVDDTEGGASDVWSTSLTGTDVRKTTFGIQFYGNGGPTGSGSYSVQLDYVGLKVYYTERRRKFFVGI